MTGTYMFENEQCSIDVYFWTNPIWMMKITYDEKIEIGKTHEKVLTINEELTPEDVFSKLQNNEGRRSMSNGDVLHYKFTIDGLVVRDYYLICGFVGWTEPIEVG